jgi:hypothetical protein
MCAYYMCTHEYLYNRYTSSVYKYTYIDRCTHAVARMFYVNMYIWVHIYIYNIFDGTIFAFLNIY